MGGGGAGTCSYKTWRSMQALGLLRGVGGVGLKQLPTENSPDLKRLLFFQSFLKPRIRIPTFKCQLKLVIMLCFSWFLEFKSEWGGPTTERVANQSCTRVVTCQHEIVALDYNNKTFKIESYFVID